MRATSTRAESRGSRPTKADSGERRTLCWRKPDSNPPVPYRGQHFSRPPRTRRRQTGSAARTGFDDRQAQVYRAPSQACPGDDINAGSPGFQKAPMRGPASLVAFGSSRPVPGDAGLGGRHAECVGGRVPAGRSGRGVAQCPSALSPINRATFRERLMPSARWALKGNRFSLKV